MTFGTPTSPSPVCAGFPYVTPRRLGHHSYAFTHDVYGHLFPETDEDAAERVSFGG